jgi:hypothetical protein
MRSIIGTIYLVATVTLVGMSHRAVAQQCRELTVTVNNLPSINSAHPLALMKADSLVLMQHECNEMLRVFTFEMVVRGRTFKTYDNRLTDQMKQALVPLRRGEQVIFRKMKARDRQHPEIVRVMEDLTVSIEG